MPTQNHTYRLTAPAPPHASTYSLFPVPYSLNFTFSAKERDIETGLSYFGSRYYSSDLSIWLSVDPQASKYPGLSPFTYCANNPVKLVDPNGEDYETVIDKESKTITIKAIYYAKDADKAILQKGIDAWNNESGKYAFSIDNGEYTGEYKVNFELVIANVNNKNAPDDGISNSFEVVSDNFGGQGITNNGCDIKIHENASERTVIHEIGHTLGNGHFFQGVMESGGKSNKILKANIAESLNQSVFECLGNFSSGRDKTDVIPSYARNKVNYRGSSDPIRGILKKL